MRIYLVFVLFIQVNVKKYLQAANISRVKDFSPLTSLFVRPPAGVFAFRTASLSLLMGWTILIIACTAHFTFNQPVLPLSDLAAFLQTARERGDLTFVISPLEATNRTTYWNWSHVGVSYSSWRVIAMYHQLVKITHSSFINYLTHPYPRTYCGNGFVTTVVGMDKWAMYSWVTSQAYNLGVIKGTLKHSNKLVNWFNT